MLTVRSLRRVVFAVIVAGLTVGTVAPGGAQPVGAPPEADDLRVVEVDATASPDIVAVAAVPASLQDATIDPLAFTVTAGGQPVGVSVEPLTADQLTVSLMLDTADDIGRSTVVAQQGAAVEFVLQLDPRSPVVIASTTAGAVFGPSTDRRLALQAVQNLARGGPRQTVVSIGSVLDAAGAGTSRRAVVVVSGGPDASGDDGSSLRSRLAGNSILQWIAAAPGGEPPAALADLATVTPSSNEALLPLLDLLAATLVGQYRLRFRADAGADVQISLALGSQSWSAPVPLPAPPVAPPDSTTLATSAAPATTVGSAAPDSTAPATTTAIASTTAASVGPPAPDQTVDTTGDEAATASVEDEGSTFPTLALVSVFLLITGVGAVLFLMRGRLQPAGVRPGSRPSGPAPPARASSPPRPVSPPRPKRGRKPASTKTAAAAPPSKKPAPKPKQRSPKPEPPSPAPPPPARAPGLPDPDPVVIPAPGLREPEPVVVPVPGLPEPEPVVIPAPSLPSPEPLAATPSASDRQPQPTRPVPYQSAEPPSAVKFCPAAPAPDRVAPRVGARPKGGYRPSRSLAKAVSGDVRSAGPYLQP